MIKLKSIIALGAAFSLSACLGGGGGGVNIDNPATALNYSPVYAKDAADTVSLSLVSDGATGLLYLFGYNSSGGATLDFKSAEVFLSPDRSTAFVTLDGKTITLSLADGATADETSGRYGNESGLGPYFTYNTAFNDNFMDIAYTEGFSGGFGVIGIETPLANLPAGSATYDGSWGGHIYPANIKNPDASFGVFLGDLIMEINFGNGNLSGTLDGFANISSGTTDPSDPANLIVGTIDGSTSGNGIVGTFNMTGAINGDISFAGKAYGFTAEDVAGVFGDTATNGHTGETQVVVGTFDAAQPP